MIIACPNCGVPGRIPSGALGSSLVARCPRCRSRFELGPMSPRVLWAAADEAGSADQGSDPNASSYELKAIEGDPSAPPLQEAGQGPANAAGQHLSSGNATILAVATAAASLSGVSGLASCPNEPWYSRVLQAWGVVFLAWAGVLLLRSVYLTATAGGQPGTVTEIVAATIAVVLLVPGAAGLFLLVDLGRYIRRLRPAQGPAPAAAAVAPVNARAPATPAPAPASAPLSASARRVWRPRRRAGWFLSWRTG
jgi:hypothetical protein